MMQGSRRTAYVPGFLLAALLCLPGALLRAQTPTLFEIRYEPTSINATETAGTVQVDVIIELVNSPPIAVDDSFE